MDGGCFMIPGDNVGRVLMKEYAASHDNSLVPHITNKFKLFFDIDTPSM